MNREEFHSKMFGHWTDGPPTNMGVQLSEIWEVGDRLVFVSDLRWNYYYVYDPEAWDYIGPDHVEQHNGLAHVVITQVPEWVARISNIQNRLSALFARVSGRGFLPRVMRIPLPE